MDRAPTNEELRQMLSITGNRMFRRHMVVDIATLLRWSNNLGNDNG